MPNSIAEMLQQAEAVVDDLNNNKQDMVVRAVFKMKYKARQCVAVGVWGKKIVRIFLLRNVFKINDLKTFVKLR